MGHNMKKRCHAIDALSLYLFESNTRTFSQKEGEDDDLAIQGCPVKGCYRKAIKNGRKTNS